MSQPITWRNVESPNLRYAMSGMEGVTQSVNNIFTGLQKELDSRNAVEKQNWDTVKGNNTKAAIAEILKYQDPAKYQAALESGQLQGMVDAYGAQVDGDKLMQLMDGRLASLQQRQTASQQFEKGNLEFKNWQVDQAQAPTVDQLKASLLGVGNPQGINNMQAAVQARVDSGELSQRAGAALMQDIFNQGRTLASDTRAAEVHQDTLATNDSTRRNNAERLRLEGVRLDESRNARIAADQLRAINEKAALAKNTTDLTEAQLKFRQDTEARTPYGKVIADDVGWEKFGTTLGTRFGADANNSMLPIIRNKFATGIKVPEIGADNKPTGQVTSLDQIPEQLLSKAAAMSTGLAITDEAKANAIVSNVYKLLQDPTVARGVTQGALARANGFRMPEPEVTKGVLPPPSNPGKPTAVANPIDQVIAPTVSKDGTLGFNDKNFRLTQSQGVMSPASIPSGKLEVKVSDGDTLAIKGSNGKSLNVRYQGIDTQETAKRGKAGQKFAEQARAFVQSEMAKGNVEVRLTSNKLDKGRHIGEIFVNGKSLNEALLEKDLAILMNLDLDPITAQRLGNAQRRGYAYGNGIMADQGNLNSMDHPSGALYRYTGETEF